MSSYYKCKLFEESIRDYKNFNFIQEELLLKDYNGSSSSFQKQNIEYKCSFHEYYLADWKKPTGIICIKDNVNLLLYTLNNLKQYKVYEYINFIIVDDRSTEDIKLACENFPVSYLRVDNKKGFNFSVINDIAAKIAFDKGSKEIVLWNSDLFVPDENQIPELLTLFKQNNATIAGTKLVYPPFSWNNEKGASHNIESVFPNKKDSYRGTIQFGGSLFTFSGIGKTYLPGHSNRFKNINYFLSCENKIDKFVTGAFQIIDIEWFIEDGGLNPSLSLNFQDVDLCLKANQDDKKVYYFGKNNYLYHDESVLTSKSKQSSQFQSDWVLYIKLWDEKKFLSSIFKVDNV